ncbi:MAG: hypothetical protein VR72_02225 [Clostridiaceae bacterium BRH_c20a]|nr:MAG: hypothetical protein VR72_02225 [Clostridiaceae bacterium BRH_c20a]
MSYLSESREDIQKIADAIAAVLDIEVIIYDNDLVVVATTGGGVHNSIGQKVRGYVIKEAMEKKCVIVNDRPGYHDLCQPCHLCGTCPEQANINCPIILNNQVLGVIGLTAFSESQRESLLRNLPGLQTFLEKISDLVKSKLAEHELVQQLSALVNKLENILDCVNEGLIAVDNNGKVLQYNKTAAKLFEVYYSQSDTTKIEDIIANIPIKEVLISGNGYTDREIPLEIAGKTIYVMSSARTMKKEGKVIGAVISFRDMRDVNKFVYEISSYQGQHSLDEIITSNTIMKHLKNKLRVLSKSSSTVLIQGESGTGKELIARALHFEGTRKEGPFITINCSAIPEALLESELFGYEEGAFTGAKKKGKPGKFELANGGTIFLDEIGDMHLYLQAKLLRVLQEREVERVGGIKPVSIDVRIIAATNRNLEEMVKNKEFREDLFFRLNVIPLFIPPLRERIEDIEPLVEHFLNKYKFVLNKEQIIGFTSQAVNFLKEYNWTGNIRELENAVEYAINMETKVKIEASSLPHRILNYSKNVETGILLNSKILPLAQIEETMIEKALKIYGDSLAGKKNAAAALGIDLSTLYRKLKQKRKNAKAILYKDN